MIRALCKALCLSAGMSPVAALSQPTGADDQPPDCQAYATASYEIALLRAAGLQPDGILREYPNRGDIIDPLFEDPELRRLTPIEIRDMSQLVCTKFLAPTSEQRP